MSEICRQLSRSEKYLPAAIPVEPRGRTPKPHGIAITEPESGQHGCARIRDQRRVEVAEPPTAYKDAGNQRYSRQQPPDHGVSGIRKSVLKKQLIHCSWPRESGSDRRRLCRRKSTNWHR